MNLQEQYEFETGKRAYEYGGIPKREYVEWLEQAASSAVENVVSDHDRVVTCSNCEHEHKQSERDLNPTAPAKVAMILYNKRYASQNLGSMGFFDSLSSTEKNACIRYAEDIKEAPMFEE